MTPTACIVVAAGAELGGAERSLLELLPAGAALFLVPRAGGLSEAVAARGQAWELFPQPSALRGWTQRGGMRRRGPALALWLLTWPGDCRRLWRRLRGASEVISLGVKSHARCLPLAPLLRRRLVFDVRDFIRPRVLRRAIAGAARVCGCRVRANSRAVARDYPGAEVVYPRVLLPRSVVPNRRAGPPWIVAHAAYFAPYKGQDVFLDLAAAWLARGVDAEFRIYGEVIYPAPEYARYAEALRARAARADLRGRVRFFGAWPDLQPALEAAHLLLHCTREPEPFGRVVAEALQCGCEAVCRRGSGVCEVHEVTRVFPGWMAPLAALLPEDYVRVTARSNLPA